MTLGGVMQGGVWYGLIPAVGAGLGVIVDATADKSCGEGLIRNWTGVEGSGPMADSIRKVVDLEPVLSGFNCQSLYVLEAICLGIAVLPFAKKGTQVLFGGIQKATGWGSSGPKNPEDVKKQQ